MGGRETSFLLRVGVYTPASPDSEPLPSVVTPYGLLRSNRYIARVRPRAVQIFKFECSGLHDTASGTKDGYLSSENHPNKLDEFHSSVDRLGTVEFAPDVATAPLATLMIFRVIVLRVD